MNYIFPQVCQELKIDPIKLVLSDVNVDQIVMLNEGEVGVRGLKCIIRRLAEKFVRAQRTGACFTVTPELIKSLV